VAFDRDAAGDPALGREAAHSVRRVLHARDTPGREIGRVLWQKVQSHPRVRVYDDALATSLLMKDGECRGAAFVDRDGRVEEVEAKRTLIATGGAGQVFRETTNPAIATGDGIAMAFDAGARVTDLEFIQFHPTALSVEGAPRFLLSEALRGEGARLVNADGERFVHRYEPAGDLASRDLVARAIVREVERTNAPVFLSMAHLDRDYVRRRFPAITQACRQAGLDLAADRIPVSPAAHYVMGGIETDLFGRTSIPGLFAAGEVACTGVHGANRLASNSLLEGLVFGARAASAMIGPLLPATLFSVEGDQIPAASCCADDVPSVHAVRDLMWRHAGLLRSRDSLEGLVSRLSAWRERLRRTAAQSLDRDGRRLSSLLTVSLLIARAALRREESRGGHFRTDFPQRDDIHWQKHISDVIGSRL
jgi:L-aspartate oxidase